MAVTPAAEVLPAAGVRPAGAVGVGRGGGAGDQRGTGAAVDRGAVAATLGLGVGFGLGDGGSTIGEASGTEVDRDGDGWLGAGASTAVREAVHPAAASRMATPAVAVRFVNESLLRSGRCTAGRRRS